MTNSAHTTARPGLLAAAVLVLFTQPAILAAAGVPDGEPPRSAPPGTSLIRLEVNGISMRVAEQGEGPAVMLLHGFPETWYSWRHQLAALAGAGYRAIAPDLRGFGGTDAPPGIEDYDVLDLCADATGLLDALEIDRAVLVGHDWGAVVAWTCALLEPERFRALVAMSVPWGPRPEAPPLAAMRAAAGDNFVYFLYFQEPGVAEAELGADPARVFRRFLASPDTPRQPPEITDPKAAAGSFLGRIGEPTERPPWLSQADLDYYTAEFARTGFAGGLNYYRNLDRSWELTAELAEAQIAVPTLFIAGARDLVLRGRGREEIEPPMRQVAPDLRGVHLIPGAGHWIQQERADQVNGLLLAFLGSLSSERRAPRRDPHPQAPPETAQFAFLVGEWDCATRFMKPDGSGYNEGRARWTGYFILDGWAIQDDWIGYGLGGQEFHGTNVRSFNPRTRKWDNRWLGAGSLAWKYFEAEIEGGTMVMIGGEGSDPRGEFVDRNVFYDIGLESWRWRKDRSYDGGQTWIEGVGFIEATRATGGGEP